MVEIAKNPTTARDDGLFQRGLRVIVSGELGWTLGVMLRKWREEGERAIETSRPDGAKACLGDSPEIECCDLLDEKEDRRDRTGLRTP